MNLASGFAEKEKEYGDMSDEAISWFRAELKKCETSEITGIDANRKCFIETLPLSDQLDIIEMYTLGYTTAEAALHFGVELRLVKSFWLKMKRIGRLDNVSVSDRRMLHKSLLESSNRGRFNDVQLLRNGKKV